MIRRNPLVEHCRTLLGSVIRGRRWVVGDALLFAAARAGLDLMELGAEAVLAIGAAQGTGEIPKADNMETLCLGMEAPGMMAAIHSADALLRKLPLEAEQAIAAFDPAGRAMAAAPLWFSGQAISGRPVLGARPHRWQVLEDKMLASVIWERACIRHAPSLDVPADLDALLGAHRSMDQGMGTVWAADNKEGWHGGATKLRWVRSPEGAGDAFAFLAPQCDRIRVMPFVDGLPCSIHAFVTDGGCFSVRPCEMLVFRRPGSDTLHYAGAATTWIPSPAQSAEMHQAVRRVGRLLGEEEGYRGSFTLDGICNAEGFFPTEINPRFGGALGRLSGSLKGLPLYLVHCAIAEGLPLDFRLDELVALIARSADSDPVARGMYLVPGLRGAEPRKSDIRRDGDGWLLAVGDAESQGSIELGPAPSGSIVLCSIEGRVVPAGCSAAPDICQALMLAGKAWDLEMESLLPAPDIR
jgi:hypothetical protein